MTTLEDKMASDKSQEDRMVVEVKDRELMMFSERICERGEKTEGRRQG